jgi:lysine 2,3-aminomutase
MQSLPLSDWQHHLAQSLRHPYEIFRPKSHPKKDSDKPLKKNLDKVIEVFPMRVTPYYADLIQTPDDPIWRQAVPDLLELDDRLGEEDPLCERKQSVVPNLIHRYSNRVLFIVSDRCAVFCRHCMRKRWMGVSSRVTWDTIAKGIDYIAAHQTIDDVILSGGDPLLLEDQAIFNILARLRKISHVRIIRIHSRIPCTLPQRITFELAQGLARFHPLWVNIQFNHPKEVTHQAQAACSLLADAGIPLGCQTVLLKDINDSADIIAELMTRLLEIRVRPYYLHHPDRVKGTRHFWVSPQRGLSILDKLRGRLSGLAIPHYMIDLPGGGGKIALSSESVLEKRRDLWRLRNHKGGIFDYPLYA